MIISASVPSAGIEANGQGCTLRASQRTPRESVKWEGETLFLPKSKRVRWIVLAILSIVVAFAAASAYWYFKDYWRGYPPKMVCYKNMRQIGLSMIQYSGDHGDKYPTSFGVLLKEGYLTTGLVFICPLRRRDVPPDFPQDFKSADLAALNTVDEWGAYEMAPGVQRDMDEDFIVLYEKPPGHRKDEGILWRDLLGLADTTRIRACWFNGGYPKLVPEERFQALMKAQEARLREMRQKEME